MKFVRSVVNFLRDGSFTRAQLYCGGRELFLYWRQGVYKGTRSKNLAVSVLLICLALITGCHNQDPIPDPGGPYSGSVGTALTFDGSLSSDSNHDRLALTWDFGDGTTATGTAPTHTYSTAGTHTVTLTASDGRGGVKSASTTATIIVPNPTDPSKTTFSKSNGLSWTSAGGENLSYVTDSGSSTTRWTFTRLAGVASSIGAIESIEFPHKCLRSPDVNSNSQVVLAPCEMNDLNQQWKGIRQQMSPGKGFYSFVNNGVQKCLTEGPGSQVIQTDYNGFDTQLWAVRKNTTNAFEVDTVP
jgi:hypothetical protein